MYDGYAWMCGTCVETEKLKRHEQTHLCCTRAGCSDSLRTASL